jgi:hypothetical protein
MNHIETAWIINRTGWEFRQHCLLKGGEAQQLFRATLQNRQALKVPTEDPSRSGLDTLFSIRRTLGPAAILQPPKPSVVPSTRILQRAAEHDVEPEAEG